MAKKKKKLNINIPDDWPRPWKELGEGTITSFGYTLLVWKKYKRPSNFKIYGFSQGKYMRIWYGRKVVHFIMCFCKTEDIVK
jgi:hypothetical protein